METTFKFFGIIPFDVGVLLEIILDTLFLYFVYLLAKIVYLAFWWKEERK